MVLDICERKRVREERERQREKEIVVCVNAKTFIVPVLSWAHSINQIFEKEVFFRQCFSFTLQFLSKCCFS